MANVNFYRSEDVEQVPIYDGQIVFSTSGDGKIYLDNGNERLPMGGGSGGGTVVLNSWAEWEALPETKYTDGIRYLIKEVV